MKQASIKIDGFRMHHAILEEFRLLRDESSVRPPASAYVVYLTMLKQAQIEQNQRGILKEYNLAFWAKKLGISYSTLWSGRKYLEDYFFIKEEIQEGLPVLVLKDVEKHNTPEHNQVKKSKFRHQKVSMNYLIIPHALFETNILAEFVRTSNPEAIELMLSLFNQFRTGMSFSRSGEVEKVKQERNMKTLKQQLNKNAKGVRKVLSILEPLFNIDYQGLSVRGNQLWIKKATFTLKQECVKENTDEFNVEPLLAKLSKELTLFLDHNGIKFKPRDQIDVMIAFKQEIVNKVKYINDEDSVHCTVRDQFLKDYFIEAIDRIGAYIEEKRQKNESFRFYSIGAFFRMAFRKFLPGALKQIPYELIHDAKLKGYSNSSQTPELHSLI